MIHIGYVLKVFPRLSQTFIVNELRAHQQAGCRVTVFSLKQPAPSDVGMVDHGLQLPIVYLRSASECWGEELAALCQAHEVTHLHAHFGNVATEVARKAAQAAQLTYTFTAHARDIFDDKVDAQELRAKITDSAGVVTVSQFNAEYLQRVFGRRPILVHNGMPLEHLPYCFDTDRPPRILAVGRLIPKKGFDCLIEACRLLNARGIDFCCDIVGDGPLHDELIVAASKAGMQNHVSFLGAVTPEEVHRRIRGAALLAAPCRIAANGDRDGLPTVLLEAMALGTPCVGTDVTGIPEVIVDRQTGLLVHEGEPEALAGACQELLQDRQQAKRLALNARALVEERFDSSRTSSVLRSVWQRPQRRIVFRIHNRRGMGHWMRSANLARELLRCEPHSDIVFYSRVQPSLQLASGIRSIAADDIDGLSFAASQIVDFQPHVYIDDTILKGTTQRVSGRRILILRRLTQEKHEALIANPELQEIDLVIVPHTQEEFGNELPDWLLERSHFVGPIVRGPDAESMARLHANYALDSADFVLVTTPGGGGFEEDAARMFRVAAEVHRRSEMPGLRHIVVRGPNCSIPMEPVDDRMTVVDVEPDLVSLLALSQFVISAGGYNSVNEIRCVKRPAFFLPGTRKYDDQGQRVQELLERGLAWSSDHSEPCKIADHIGEVLSERGALERLSARYETDTFVAGNEMAAQLILTCAHH